MIATGERVGKWMTAEEVGSPKAKTKVWVISGSDDLPLGQVRWYSSWRQYTFWPLDGTSMSAGCLSDLGRWVLTKTGEHMARLSDARSANPLGGQGKGDVDG